MSSTAESPHTTQERFNERIAAIRDKMRAARIHAVLIYKIIGEYFPYGGIGYARYVMPWISPPIPPAMILITAEGSVHCLLMDGLGAAHVAEHLDGLIVRNDTRMAGMVRGEAIDFLRVLQDVDATEEFSAGTVGVVLPTELPVWLDQGLKREFPNTKWADATHILDDLMPVKNADDLAGIERAAQLGDIAFESVFSTIEVGMTEVAVSGAACSAVFAEGAVYADIRVATGRPGDPQHGVRPSSKKLVQEGDHIHVGVDINYDGYWTNVVKRGVMGVADPDHRRLHGIAVEMQAAAINELREGNVACEAALASMRSLEAAGVSDLPGLNVQRLGHGIGLENQEHPFLIASEAMIVRNDMTFAVHAGFSIPGGPQVANGDIVRVTAEGPVRLTSYPSELVEVSAR